MSVDLHEVARCLCRDVQTAGARYGVAVARDPELVQELQMLMQLLGVGQRPISDEVVELQRDGERLLAFPIGAAEDAMEDVRGGLDQAQDVIMEDITEPWPPCPLRSHRHPALTRCDR